MHNKTNKFVILFIGIILGFFIGSGIVWYKLTNSINDLFSLYKGLLFEKNQKELKTIVSNSVDEDELKEKKYSNTYIPDSVFRNDEKREYSNSEIDSLYSDSHNDNKTSEFEIIVAKDEMTALRKYQIEGSKITSQNEKTNLDSLLTDDKTSKKKKNENYIMVEFWKSPINYKGYRYDNYKLIIFGLNDFDVTKFKYYNGNLYFKCKNDFYGIEPSEKFLPFSIVSDSELIKKLYGK